MRVIFGSVAETETQTRSTKKRTMANNEPLFIVELFSNYYLNVWQYMTGKKNWSIRKIVKYHACHRVYAASARAAFSGNVKQGTPSVSNCLASVCAYSLPVVTIMIGFWDFLCA